MFEEVTLGPERAIMAVATIVAPYTDFTFELINKDRAEDGSGTPDYLY